jgi:hypothetical protein
VATTNVDWEKLARRATGYLEALAKTVSPEEGQEEASESFSALAGAMGRPPDAPRFRAEIDSANPLSIKLFRAPKGASNFRVRDADGNVDTGSSARSPLGLKTVDTTKKPVVVELFDDDMVLLARETIT